jgi:Ca-activated chloride channel family protein
MKVKDLAKQLHGTDGKNGVAGGRDKFAADALSRPAAGKAGEAQKEALEQKKAFDEARQLFMRRELAGVQAGKLGVDLSVQTNNLRNQTRMTQTASRMVNKRNCLEVGGVWIDEKFDPKMKSVTVKAMSPAYFQIIERQPKMREVFGLGNYLIWISPSGAALIVDQNDGQTEMEDADIDRLFVAAVKK